MGKSHRDNVKARAKAAARGRDVYSKRAKRRKPVSRCAVCGGKCRPHKMVNDLCPQCRR